MSDTTVLHGRDQLVNAVQTNNRCSFRKSYETNKRQVQVFLTLKWTERRPHTVLFSL
jgi:hypothetical protein